MAQSVLCRLKNKIRYVRKVRGSSDGVVTLFDDATGQTEAREVQARVARTDPAPPATEGAVISNDQVPSGQASAAPQPALECNGTNAPDEAITNHVDGLLQDHSDSAVTPERAPQNGSADQKLDDELAEWYADELRRPKISILGTAEVVGLGRHPARKQARQIEIAVYLALYPTGVTASKFTSDLWPEGEQPTDGARRVAISRLRAWLGSPPGSDKPFLPTGTDRYILADRLLDSELFDALVQRSDSRAELGGVRDALNDLQTALSLVRGPVLPESGGRMYSWLALPERMEDRTLPMKVIDAAHSAADLALALGDPVIAEEAAAVARTVDPYSNIPLCDLIRIAQFSGDAGTASRWAEVILELNEVDIPDDLPSAVRDLVKEVLLPRKRRTHRSDSPP